MDKAGCVHGGILPAARHLHHVCGKINSCLWLHAGCCVPAVCCCRVFDLAIPFLVLRCSIRMVASRISQTVSEMDCDVRELDGSSLYKLLTGSVLPRPIAWLSTQDLLGVANLAPFSFFTVAGLNPPLLAVTI
jgi:hypothetical protein